MNSYVLQCSATLTIRVHCDIHARSECSRMVAVHHGSCTRKENAMNPHDPTPATPLRPKPGEVPSPVRDVPPGQPTDLVFPPLHDPGVNPDPGAPVPDDLPAPRGP
jgi:hypothetical protein